VLNMGCWTACVYVGTEYRSPPPREKHWTSSSVQGLPWAALALKVRRACRIGASGEIGVIGALRLTYSRAARTVFDMTG